MKTFKAFRIHQDGRGFRAGLEDAAPAAPADGEIMVAVAYSSINYKDALAGTGSAPILRKSPLTGGIDLAGEVIESRSPRFEAGEQVLVNGGGLGENLNGGYAPRATLPAEIAIPIPRTLDARKAMLIGTAGFTAALAVRQMRRNGQQPAMGPVLVSGASGGVGSFATHLLAQLGFEVVAVSRKKNVEAYLRGLGAAEVIGAAEIVAGDLGKGRWGGGIDSLGGATLANLLKSTRPQGNVVSVGLAQSSDLRVSVMPFIIRGVNLLGVTSTNCPPAVKREVWETLGGEALPQQACFDAVLAQEVPLADLPACFDRILKGEVRGRILVACR